MMKYVIYITDETGKRIKADSTVYDTCAEACEVSDKMRKENPACKAAAVKVMRKA